MEEDILNYLYQLSCVVGHTVEFNYISLFTRICPRLQRNKWLNVNLSIKNIQRCIMKTRVYGTWFLNDAKCIKFPFL